MLYSTVASDGGYIAFIVACSMLYSMLQNNQAGYPAVSEPCGLWLWYGPRFFGQQPAAVAVLLVGSFYF